MKEYVLDRFEGPFAVLEGDDGEFINVDASLLEDAAKEADVLIFDGGRYLVHEQKTDMRKQKIREKFESLLRRKEEDDL